MRLAAADLERTRTTTPNLWSLVKAPEAFGADLGIQGRLRLQELPDLLRRPRRPQPAPESNKSAPNPLPAASACSALSASPRLPFGGSR